MDRRHFFGVAGGVASALVVAGCEWGIGGPEHAPVATNVEDAASAKLRRQIGEHVLRLPGHVEVDYQIDKGILKDVAVTIDPEKLAPIPPEVEQKVKNAAVFIGGTSNEDPNMFIGGSGFFLLDESSRAVLLMTAGHVEAEITPNELKITASDNRTGTHAHSTFAFVLEENELKDLKEDMAIINLRNAEDFRQVALIARNLDAEPLAIGEQLITVNFQQQRRPGNPAMYTMVYISEYKNNMGLVVGGIQPGENDDELRGGASGGVIVDMQARVVGIATASTSRKGISIFSRGCAVHPFTEVKGTILGQQNIKHSINIRKAGGLCIGQEKPSMGLIRLVNNGATFDFSPP